MAEQRVEPEHAPVNLRRWSDTVGAPALDRRTTLALVEHVSLAGSGAVTPAVLLDRICATVAAAFGFEAVTSVRLHAPATEVNDVADPYPGLLARAQESRRLVLVAGSEGGGPFAFALPLMSGDRCLGIVHGSRGTRGLDDGDAEALTTVGVLASILLDDALALEQAQQRDALKSEFIALAAHELRNPLSSIYGISVTLDEQGETVSDSERLALRESLRDQTTRMQALIEQLLDLSRFDLAALEISPQRVRLRPRIDQLVRSLVGGRPGAVTIAVPAELEAFVDAVALDRMLSNLVVNALRHGEPPVTVSASGSGTHVRLTVEDHGEGVPREFVPRLFGRFTRSREALGRTNGSGLGLSIAQAYARAHGGDIVYTPAEPHGSRFEVVLPLGAPPVSRSSPQKDDQ
jgi:signal transduction histidine kinase